MLLELPVPLPWLLVKVQANSLATVNWSPEKARREIEKVIGNVIVPLVWCLLFNEIKCFESVSIGWIQYYFGTRGSWICLGAVLDKIQELTAELMVKKRIYILEEMETLWKKKKKELIIKKIKWKRRKSSLFSNHSMKSLTYFQSCN